MQNLAPFRQLAIVGGHVIQVHSRVALDWNIGTKICNLEKLISLRIDLYRTRFQSSQTLNPKPYTVHPAPYTVHRTPYTLHPKP